MALAPSSPREARRQGCWEGGRERGGAEAERGGASRFNAWRAEEGRWRGKAALPGHRSTPLRPTTGSQPLSWKSESHPPGWVGAPAVLKQADSARQELGQAWKDPVEEDGPGGGAWPARGSPPPRPPRGSP